MTIEGGRLVVSPRGLDKLWSFTRRLDVPLSQVKGATADSGVRREPKGIRAPGLSIPGKYAGTFHRDGEKTFWNVSDPRGTSSSSWTAPESTTVSSSRWTTPAASRTRSTLR